MQLQYGNGMFLMMMSVEYVVFRLMDVVQTVISQVTIVLFLLENVNMSFICIFNFYPFWYLLLIMVLGIVSRNGCILQIQKLNVLWIDNLGVKLPTLSLKDRKKLIYI